VSGDEIKKKKFRIDLTVDVGPDGRITAVHKTEIIYLPQALPPAPADNTSLLVA
jgi:hypothetical protein